MRGGGAAFVPLQAAENSVDSRGRHGSCVLFVAQESVRLDPANAGPSARIEARPSRMDSRTLRQTQCKPGPTVTRNTIGFLVRLSEDLPDLVACYILFRDGETPDVCAKSFVQGRYPAVIGTTQLHVG